MDSQETCPPLAIWQQMLEEKRTDASTIEGVQHLESCCRCQAVVEGLTKGNRTWVGIATELRQPHPALPSACRRALEEVNKHAFAPPPKESLADFAKERPVIGNSELERPRMTACIHVERMMHLSSIAVTGDSAACYTLVKLIPSGLSAATKPLALNLALALDVSGSMYEEDNTGVSRLKRVQNAAIGAMQNLGAADTLAIIGFAHNARVLLPPTPMAEKGKVEEVIRRIDMFDLDPGGTAMDEGLALAMTEVEKNAGAEKASQVMVLTDGETAGEQNCRTLAQKAAEKKIPLTLMGVGLDWKASLIKDLANISHGKWYYIEAHEAQETARIFTHDFESLAATAFKDVEMCIRPTKDVRIKRIRQVVPEIDALKLEEVDERGLVAKLGALRHDVSSRYVIDLSLPRRPDGKYVVAHLEMTYDMGTGRRESSRPIPLEMTYSAGGPGYVNAEVMKHIDDIQLKEMSDILQSALQTNDQQAAVQIAQEIKTKSTQIGKRGAKITRLAEDALKELRADGRVRKQTQLAIDDAARSAEIG